MCACAGFTLRARERVSYGHAYVYMFVRFCVLVFACVYVVIIIKR